MNAHGRVLIVDDQPSAIKVLSAILKEESHTVLESNSAYSAIETIKSEGVDAIITDLRMPGKDGYQLFEYVKEYYPDVPVIFLTAFGTVDSAVTALTMEPSIILLSHQIIKSLKAFFQELLNSIA